MVYFTTIKHCNIKLTKSDEIALTQRANCGDAKAIALLIESILPWIVKISKKFRGCGLNFDDIVQMGNLGAVKSLANFDPTRGRLSTYATAAAISEIQRGISRNGVIRVPYTAFSSTNPKIKEYASRARNLQSLDGDDDIAEKINEVEEPISAHDLQKLRDAINSLDKRQALLIKQRLRGKSLKEIGTQLGVVKERARQLEITALAALRLAMGQQHHLPLASLASIMRGSKIPEYKEIVQYNEKGIRKRNKNT